jgi:(E)-4-hydroxy-3-methyl-but-2-enyl pyrophosphate reductase
MQDDQPLPDRWVSRWGIRELNIRVVKTAGFCWGVRRALSMVSDTAQQAGGPIYSLGPVIHNPQTVERLREELGIEMIDSVDEVDGGTVVIRTHGVGPAVFERARKKGLEVLDATCPFVSKIQEYAKMLTAGGYRLFIIGERDHPEVLGIIAHAGGHVSVLESADDVRKLGKYKRAGVVIQSTQEKGSIKEIISELLSRVTELRVFNTICNATLSRQAETRELAQKVEVMVVVGGRNSGNTSRLVDICRAAGAITHHIEDASELEPEWFKGIDEVGITAGASTPDFVLEKVLENLQEIGEKRSYEPGEQG